MKKLIITKEQYDRLVKEGASNLNTLYSSMSKNKKKVKITKEQYEKLVAVGLIKEDVQINGGTKRVDKAFKKEFAGKKITNPSSSVNVDESEQFNITKPNTDIPRLPKAVGNRKEPVREGGDNLKNETLGLIKYLYRKTDEFSPFWEENGLTYDDICDVLLSKKIIVSKNGRYELSKKLGSPQAAIQSVEDELKVLVQTQPEGEIAETDNYSYPEGSDTSDAPWNQKEPDMTKATVSKNPQLKVVSINGEIAVLQSPDGSLYVFYYYDKEKSEFAEFASVQRHFTGKDENGYPEYEYDNEFEIDGDVIGNYVNYNLSNLTKGEGYDDFERGNADLVKIDDELKQDLLSVYDKDKNLVNALSTISEDVVDNFKDSIKKAFTVPSRKPDPNETPEQAKERLELAIAKLKEKEMARRKAAGEIDEMTALGGGGGVFQSSGHNNYPVTPLSGGPIKKKESVPVVAEMTSGNGSVGAYDANALPGIARDGSFKESKPTKAEKVPQWAGGGFVKQPECSKLNNNKEAQNGGCNQGGSSLNVVKGKGSINAPSIGEEKIYEIISKKTGKTIEEVKKIIQSKNNKPL